MAGWAAISPPSARLFAEGGPDRAVIGVDEVEGRYPGRTRWRGAAGRPGDPRLVGPEAGGVRLGGLCAQGVSGRMAEGAAGGLDRPARDRGAAGGAQPPERLRGLCGGAGAGAGAEADRGGASHSFAGLPHRSQLVAERGGRAVRERLARPRTWTAAAKALQAFPKHPLDRGRAWARRAGIAALKPHLGRW